MYSSASRSAGALIGACSISKATPSRFEAASAAAVSMSTEPKPTKAVLPCSSARMTLFSRGISAMALSLARSGDLVLQAAVDAARVALVDLAAVLVADADRVDVALGVVVVVAGLRVDAAHGADHLRGEENVVGGEHLEQEVDAGLVIDARVEEHVVQQVVLQQRLLEILGDAAVAAPVVRDRAAAEVMGKERGPAMDQVVAHLRPVQARGRVADVVPHAGGPRREDRHVGPALALELELGLVDRLPDLISADADGALRAGARGVLQLRDLLLPIGLELLRCRRVVAVTIDDHEALRRGTPE